MKTRDNLWILIVGLIISIISFSLAFLKIHHWYFLAIIGVWFVFDYFSSIKNNNNTALQIFKKNKKEFFHLYSLMFLLGCGIELIGRFLLNLWIYPYINSIYSEFLILIFYPFILISFREMYKSVKIIVKKNWPAFALSMILGIILWEIPNLFSEDWIYTIPYINFNIYGINIIVIFGWSILIGPPVYIYNKFFKK